MTIRDIITAHEAAGGFYFTPDTMRFFRSQIRPTVYEGPGGIFFVTSEQFVGSAGPQKRCYTVRQFHPDRCNISTYGRFNELTKSAAMAKARRAAKGEEVQ